ncbi:MAG: hypothetical protein IKZ82_06210 [Clostridia bacterium]|nr:hypothetical protein [Clostridia bacterium]
MENIENSEVPAIKKIILRTEDTAKTMPHIRYRMPLLDRHIVSEVLIAIGIPRANGRIRIARPIPPPMISRNQYTPGLAAFNQSRKAKSNRITKLPTA